LAEDWVEQEERVELSVVRNLRREYSGTVLPAGVVAVTAFCDVQKDGIYCATRAWGLEDQSWGLEARKILRRVSGLGSRVSGEEEEKTGSDFEQVDKFLRATWQTEDGRTLSLARMGIDARYRTWEVYLFCRQRKDRVLACMGSAMGIPEMFRFSRLEKNERTGKAYAGGFRVWHWDTAFFKDRLHALREREEVVWRIPMNATADYLEQITSEHKILVRDSRGQKRGVWVKKPGSVDNHYWDCEVGNVLIAEMLGLPYMVKGPGRPAPARRGGMRMGDGRAFLVSNR
jgi:phage terminase large subunit GpA-like protein